MKLPALFAIVFMTVITCAFSGKTKTLSFDGKWTETWGVGQKTDVNYHDRYTIATNSDGTKEITCQSSDHYKFIDISINQKLLTFKMINTSGNDTLPYSLMMDKKGKKMKGTAISIRGVKTNIEWNRDK